MFHLPKPKTLLLQYKIESNQPIYAQGPFYAPLPIESSGLHGCKLSQHLTYKQLHTPPLPPAPGFSSLILNLRPCLQLELHPRSALLTQKHSRNIFSPIKLFSSYFLV